MPAAAFVDSVGVNVHMGYNDTPYARLADIRARLAELGVRHVRDGFMTGRPDQWRALEHLCAAGIRSTLIADSATEASRSEAVTTIGGRLAGCVEAIEGPNEYDLSGDANWPTVLRQRQQDLYSAIKRNAATSQLPVLAPALGRAGSYGQLGDLSGVADLGNIHPYAAGRAPGDDGFLSEQFGLGTRVAGPKPVVASEAGYHNAVAYSGDHAGVSESTAGAYLPRMFLDHFRRGIARTYAYELVDPFANAARDSLDSHFGLLRHDLSPKPAFHALRNLLTILSDPGGANTAGSSRPTVEGVFAGVRRLLLSKSDGSIYLVLWQDASLYDLTAKRDVTPPARQVTVQLGSAAGEASLYRPALSTGRVAYPALGNSVSVTVPADPVILQVSPPARPTGRARRGSRLRVVLARSLRLTARVLLRTGRRRLARAGRFAAHVPARRGTLSFEVRSVRGRGELGRLLGRRVARSSASGRLMVRLNRSARRRLRAHPLRVELRITLRAPRGGRRSASRRVFIRRAHSFSSSSTTGSAPRSTRTESVPRRTNRGRLDRAGW